jgi:LuxR family maltose regulon positive regulatory protein
MGSTRHANPDGAPFVIATKLLVPRPRPETVVRERVHGLLDDALECPLTVVVAPAGYGKTTALVTWLATVEEPCAWVSLDEMDTDPRRLFAHLIAAVEDVLPGATGDAAVVLNGGADPMEAVIPLMVGAMADHVRGRLLIVLDDYHVIDSTNTHAVVAALVDALPPSVGLIVSSRRPPPLRIARRRVLGTVRELGSAQLAFQAGESGRLLNDTLDLGLGDDAIAAIEALVEGWPVGLALVASSLTGHANPTRYLNAFERQPQLSGTGIAEYLLDEVLNHVSPRLRDFLCRTSILGRLSGPLCVAVLEDERAIESLAEVRRSNLFVTVLDERGGVEWLRYHHLFAELLERELRARSPDIVPTLHRRAAEWFARSGMHEEAITHAGLGGDGRRAAALLWDCWDALMAQWRFVTIRRLIAEMPADRGELAGFCEALDTVCWALEGADPRLVVERLDALERCRDAPGVAPIIDRSRVTPLYGDIGRAVSDGWAAWERHSDPAFRTETSGQFGQVLWFAGEPDRAREIIEPYLGELRRPAARTWAFGTLALIAAGEGDVELAERYGREAANAIKLPAGAGTREAHFGHTALAEALRVGGRLDEAAEELAQAARLTGTSPTSFMHAFTLMFEAQLALTQRDHGRAREKAAAARAILGRYPDPGVVADRLAAIEAALANGSARPLEGSEPTAAELRVLALLATDLTVKQIAEHLYLSVKTVGAHRRRLYRRLGVASRQDAVEVARQRGLLPSTTA